MKEKFELNPWEVTGKVDYSRIVKEFGLKEFTNLPRAFMENILFRRGVIFAHRDFERILDAISKKKKFVMLTGLMPTGKFHIGHMIIAMQMVFYQKLGAKVYVCVADVEAYNARGQDIETSRRIALEDYIPNYVALGLDLKKTDIYFQSERSKDGAKSNAYYLLQNLFAKHLTFNEFKAVYGEITPGKMVSALLQMSDILHPQLPEFEGACPIVVPVGVDQDPHIRLARDVSQRISSPKLMQFSSTYNIFIPGLKGGKMSSSDATSYISPTDSAKEVESKIKKYAFSGGRDTLEEHRKKGGDTNVDVSFQYLKYLFEPDDAKLEKIRKDYSSGKMLTSELKAITTTKINAFFKEHQARLVGARKEVGKGF